MVLFILRAFEMVLVDPVTVGLYVNDQSEPFVDAVAKLGIFRHGVGGRGRCRPIRRF
jgi:hypothetical protein